MGSARSRERTKTPGVYRRHATSCRQSGKCRCSYVVVWRDAHGKQHKEAFPTYELARERKQAMGARKESRQPRSRATVAAYYEQWLPTYSGLTSRGFSESTRSEYEISFRLHILPFAIARSRLSDLEPADVRAWFGELERAGGTPSTVRRAKAALSAMLASAVQERGGIPINPVSGARYVPQVPSEKRKPRALTAADVIAILDAMPEQWRAFFTMLAQTGVRIGELLGLTWENVHLGDDPHILIVEQVYRGQRKRLKTDASEAPVPLSSSMAAWLTELRAGAAPQAPVFASRTGDVLTYANVYNRVLRPALVDAGLAVKVSEKTVKVRRRGKVVEKQRPVYDYQGVAFHAFRKACGSLLLAHGKTPKQVQGWLRHSQLTTTMNVYVTPVDGGLGDADVWDAILDGGVTAGATQDPETAANATAETPHEMAQQSQSAD